MSFFSHSRQSLLARATVGVIVVILLKLAAHGLGWELISLNPLFSGIVAASIFLMGFLLSGVMSDYKESERLPGELAVSLEAITDEVATLWETKRAHASRRCLYHLLDLAGSIQAWFYKQEPTRHVMDQVVGLSRDFVGLETVTQANFIARLKQEQSNVRRLITRIHGIRETSFIPSGYVIAKATTSLLILGLVLVQIDPFYESLFFVGVITFLLRFLDLLIKDLDNPFGYYEQHSAEDVSLKPILDTMARLRLLVAQLPPDAGLGEGPSKPLAAAPSHPGV